MIEEIFKYQKANVIPTEQGHKFIVNLDDFTARSLLEFSNGKFNDYEIETLRARAFIEDGKEIEKLNEKIEELEDYIAALEKRLANIVMEKE